MEKIDVLSKIERIADLPVLPEAAARFNEMAADGNVSMDEISRVLGHDQAVVVKILKIANSVFYGLAKRVETMKHAVVMLGLNTVRNAVLSLSVIDMFNMDDSNREAAHALWSHSLEVAVTSQHLSKATGIGVPDDCFVGGLLHDVGKLVLLHYFNDAMNQICDRMKETNAAFSTAEKKIVATNHAEIGAMLARKWQLPDGLESAIRNHHTLAAGASDFERVKVVHAADAVVNAHIGDYLGRKRVLRPDPGIGLALRRYLDRSNYWFKDLEPQILNAHLILFKWKMEK